MSAAPDSRPLAAPAAGRVGLALLLLLASACAGRPAPLDAEAYAAALGDRSAFRSGLERSCSALSVADEIIAEAIAIGAPIYNSGSPLGCYRIYEGAAYKMLFALDGSCAELAAFLRAGLARAEAQAAVPDKAWSLRRTFDAILGEATRYGPSPEPLL